MSIPALSPSRPDPAPRATSERRERSSDFGPLVQRIRAAGLLEKRRGWYLAHGLLVLALLGAVAVGLILLSGSWWALLLAPAAALVSAQISFLGHDAGHHQVTASRRAGHAIGLITGNLLTGLSFGWWQDKHQRHHANPNHEGLDPDVGEGVISWSERQQTKKTGVARLLARYQAWLFFGLLTLEGWHLKLSGLRALRERPRDARRVEAALLILHALGYLGFLIMVLHPLQALVFVLIHQAVYGLALGCAFAPNHKGMAMPEAGVRLDHLRKQVLTSRDVSGSWWVDVLLGGLNYQIEHHLFPSMPRPHLRLAQPIIRDYCAEIGLPYREAGVIDSYGQCLSYLNQVGRSGRHDAPER